MKAIFKFPFLQRLGSARVKHSGPASIAAAMPAQLPGGLDAMSRVRDRLSELKDLVVKRAEANQRIDAAMNDMRSLQTPQHLSLWKEAILDRKPADPEAEAEAEADADAEDADYRAWITFLQEEKLGFNKLLVGLLERNEPWATDAFFDLLYVKSELQSDAVSTLGGGFELPGIEVLKKRYAYSSIRATVALAYLDRFDVLIQLLRRGPPPGFDVPATLSGSTTLAGWWLDALSSEKWGTPSSFPEAMLLVPATAVSRMAEILADSDPEHSGTGCLQGTVAGAAFFGLMMQRSIAAKKSDVEAEELQVDCVEPTQAPSRRRSIGV